MIDCYSNKIYKSFELYLSILDEKLKEYMLLKNLSKEDFKVNGRHLVYPLYLKQPEEFFYKKELILICNYNVMQNVGMISVEYEK